jgi:hypothetical protein
MAITSPQGYSKMIAVGFLTADFLEDAELDSSPSATIRRS